MDEHEGMSAATASFVFDSVAPAVTLGSPPNTSYGNTTRPTFSGHRRHPGAADASHSADSSTVTVAICTGMQASCDSTSLSYVETLSATESGGAWSVTPTVGQALPANAQYIAEAYQSDGAGNTGHSSANTFVIDTVAPAPTIGATTPAPDVNSTSTPTIAGTTAGTEAADSSHERPRQQHDGPSTSTRALVSVERSCRRSPRPSVAAAPGRSAKPPCPRTPSTPSRSPRATAPATSDTAQAPRHS